MTHRTVIVTGCLRFASEQVSHLLVEKGYETHFLDEICAEDITYGYAHVDNDVCVAAAAIIGQYVRYLKENDAEGACVLACELCHDCRAASISALMESTFQRSGLSEVEIITLPASDLRTAACNVPCRTEDSPGTPVVGLCGSIPSLLTSEFHRVVKERLVAEGCHVVTPPIDGIVDRKDFLTPAIEYFDKLGITTVICVLPFGCLGGHVFARGQARKLQHRFPHIGITMLDYDLSASDINVVNRTELVIQSAKERAL